MAKVIYYIGVVTYGFTDKVDIIIREHNLTSATNVAKKFLELDGVAEVRIKKYVEEEEGEG